MVSFRRHPDNWQVSDNNDIKIGRFTSEFVPFTQDVHQSRWLWLLSEKSIDDFSCWKNTDCYHVITVGIIALIVILLFLLFMYLDASLSQLKDQSHRDIINSHSLLHYNYICRHVCHRCYWRQMNLNVLTFFNRNDTITIRGNHCSGRNAIGRR